MEDQTLDLSSITIVDKQAQSRRAAILAAALLMGAVIPLIIFIPLASRSASQAMQGDDAVFVSVSLGADRKLTSARETESPDLRSLSQIPEEDSLTRYINEQPVVIAKREYIEFGAAPRLFESEFVLSLQDDDAQYQEPYSEIEMSNAAKQRYSSTRSRFEFQGGFKLKSPKENIELGSAYVDYVKRSFGSPFAPKLNVIEGERNLLKGAAMSEEISLDSGR